MYNGEIYSYLDLRKELLDRNVELKSTSDTEVLFRRLAIFGVEQTLPKLNGM